MKFRVDFVTNSSSSSFIVQTNKEVPDKYKNVVKTITNENLCDFMENRYYDNYGGCLTYKMGNDDVKECGGFTDEQMAIVYAVASGDLDLYFDLKEKIESGIPVYYVDVDRDWYWGQDELIDFVNDSDEYEVVEYE